MKFKPVAWLTTFYATLGAIVSANQLYPLIPEKIMAIIGFVGVVVSIVLGVKTFNRVTPVARPRDAQGGLLVPKS